VIETRFLHSFFCGGCNATCRPLKSSGVSTRVRWAGHGAVKTYIKVKGRWTYLYRAVDKQGRTVDFLLSERRDVATAKRFFRKALANRPTPRVITLDAYAASHRAITELKSAGTMARRVRIRSSKYLNNVVEQDHRRIKHRIRPMLGFKRFEAAAITIGGIELAAKIRKHQFKTGKLLGRPKTVPDIWATILAA
jgi:transposase-like protein